MQYDRCRPSRCTKTTGKAVATVVRPAAAGTLALSALLLALCSGPAVAEGLLDRVDENAEEFQEKTSERVLKIANGIDSLFGDDRVDDETQQTRVRAYSDLEYDSDSGTDFALKLRVHLVLPNTKERLRLDFNGSDDPDSINDEDEDRETANEERERDVGLNLSAVNRSRSKLDLGLGVRYRDSSLSVYEKARHRYNFSGDKWLPRLTNEIRHYGDTGWQYKGQLDFDRSFSEQWFFRTRSELRWYENDETDEDDLKCNDGYCVNQHFSLYQRLDSPRHALAYDWFNYMVTEPDSQVDEVRLQVRYRKRVKWDWLRMEVRPRLRFLEEDDYDSRWSLLFRLEGVFGYDPVADVEFRQMEQIEERDQVEGLRQD